MGKLLYAVFYDSNPFFWFISLMMEALRTSETSVNFNVTTRRYIPEDSKLHIAALRTWNLTQWTSMKRLLYTAFDDSNPFFWSTALMMEALRWVILFFIDIL
jgi:hypothetical protein